MYLPFPQELKKEPCGLRIKNTSGGQQAWFSVHLELFGTNKNPRIPLMATARVCLVCPLVCWEQNPHRVSCLQTVEWWWTTGLTRPGCIQSHDHCDHPIRIPAPQPASCACDGHRLRTGHGCCSLSPPMLTLSIESTET